MIWAKATRLNSEDIQLYIYSLSINCSKGGASAGTKEGTCSREVPMAYSLFLMQNNNKEIIKWNPVSKHRERAPCTCPLLLPLHSLAPASCLRLPPVSGPLHILFHLHKQIFFVSNVTSSEDASQLFQLN